MDEEIANADWATVIDGLIKRARTDWGHLGETVSPSGTLWIAHTPKVARLAYLHRFWPGVEPTVLDDFEVFVGRRLPGVWREFLLIRNGLKIFNLNLYGAVPRDGHRRDSADPQPMWMDTEVRYPPRRLSAREFVIGGISDGDGELIVLRENGSIDLMDRAARRVHRSYPSGAAMLPAEYERQLPTFDGDGVKTMQPVEATGRRWMQLRRGERPG